MKNVRACLPQTARTMNNLLGDKSWTQTIFRNFSGTAGTSQQNPGVSRPRSLVSLVSRHMPDFWPPALQVEDPHPHRKISGPKSLSLCSFFLPDFCRLLTMDLVHHIAATQIAAMHNADFLQRKWLPLFYSVIAVMAHPVLQHRRVNYLTSRASPFGLCFHFSFRHNGFLYTTTRILPRVTTQRCRHWQRGMAIANANANAAMRCTKTMEKKVRLAWLRPGRCDQGFGVDMLHHHHDWPRIVAVMQTNLWCLSLRRERGSPCSHCHDQRMSVDRINLVPAPFTYRRCNHLKQPITTTAKSMIESVDLVP